MLRCRPYLLFVVGLCACGGQPAEPKNVRAAVDAITFRVDGTLDILRADNVLLSLDIEIADTDSTRRRGMMDRQSFPPRSGMLFLFDEPRIQTFWMASTPLSLDLLFIGADSQIVEFSKYAKPFSPDGISSRVPAQHVLEVPAGFVDTHGIIEGDRVKWQRIAE